MNTRSRINKLLDTATNADGNSTVRYTVIPATVSPVILTTGYSWSGTSTTSVLTTTPTIRASPDRRVSTIPEKTGVEDIFSTDDGTMNDSVPNPGTLETSTVQRQPLPDIEDFRNFAETADIPPNPVQAFHRSSLQPAHRFSTASMFNPALKQLFKWNISFDGQGDPINFLEEVEELRHMHGLTEDELLPGMTVLLRGSALLWFRNNRLNWSNWYEFEQEFKEFYLPADYLIRLEEQVSRRVQKPREPGANFIIALQTLMRRIPLMTPQKQLYLLHRNLLPEYRRFVTRNSFSTVGQLLQRVKEYEELKTDEATYSGVVKNSAVVQTVTKPAQTDTRSIQTIARPAQDLPQRRRTPEPRTNPTALQNILCFRCGETGHYRGDCQNQARLFCSRCLKPGIQSRHCDCATRRVEN